MCIAVPGILVGIDDDGLGKADIRGNMLPVELGIVDAKVGDALLIHAGCAISVISKTEAEELDELFAQINAYGQ